MSDSPSPNITEYETECPRCALVFKAQLADGGQLQAAQARIADLERELASQVHIAYANALAKLRHSIETDRELAQYQAVAHSEKSSVLDAWIKQAAQWKAHAARLASALNDLAVDCESGMIQTEADPEDGQIVAREIHDHRIAQRCRAALSATPADSLKHYQELEAHAGRLASFVSWCQSQVPPADTYGFLSELEKRLAALSATPGDSLAYLSSLENLHTHIMRQTAEGMMEVWLERLWDYANVAEAAKAKGK